MYIMLYHHLAGINRSKPIRCITEMNKLMRLCVRCVGVFCWRWCFYVVFFIPSTHKNTLSIRKQHNNVNNHHFFRCMVYDHSSWLFCPWTQMISEFAVYVIDMVLEIEREGYRDDKKVEMTNLNSTNPIRTHTHTQRYAQHSLTVFSVFLFVNFT